MICVDIMVLFGLEIVGGGVMIVIEGDMVVWGLEEGRVVGVIGEESCIVLFCNEE